MNKNVKKVLAATLAMACCASFATTALAETNETDSWAYNREDAIDSVNSYLNVTWGVGGVYPLLCKLTDDTLKNYHDNEENYKSIAVTAYNEVVEVLKGKQQGDVGKLLNSRASSFGVKGRLNSAEILSDSLAITGYLQAINGLDASEVYVVAYPAYSSTAPATSAVPQTQELTMSLANNTAAVTALTRSDTAVIK